MHCADSVAELYKVAIPLGQGQVFNKENLAGMLQTLCRNPFGSGTGF